MRIQYYMMLLATIMVSSPLVRLSAQGQIATERDIQIVALNHFMDSWHQAAAEANAEAFFSKMSKDGIYIGTDKTERWLRDELREWSSKAFERESAWAFKATERNWKIISEKKIAICDELLETWMGPCRSTAILIQDEDNWKITHYQLSVTIDNDKVDDFKALTKVP